jgi:hypothetical protein
VGRVDVRERRQLKSQGVASQWQSKRSAAGERLGRCAISVIADLRQGRWFDPKCDKFSRRLAIALSFLIAAPVRIAGTANAAADVAAGV